jgi:hypothetical protein
MKEKIIIDGAIATPALTMPWWLHIFEEWAQFGITVVTLILVCSRLYVLYKDHKEK